MLNENHWAISFQWFNSSITYSTKKKKSVKVKICYTILYASDTKQCLCCSQNAAKQKYLRTQAEIELSLVIKFSGKIFKLFYNTILFCFVEHLYFECDRHGQREATRLIKRKLVASFTITVGWDWASRSSKTFH